jgi:hypothetical protein
MNVQVVCTIHGEPSWISDPVNGSRHDDYCQEESGMSLTMKPGNWIGDKGYTEEQYDHSLQETRDR